MFHSFLSDVSKQYAATNTAHSKRLIELLKEQKVLTSSLSTIWENTDGCADQYVPQHYTLFQLCRNFIQL